MWIVIIAINSWMLEAQVVEMTVWLIGLITVCKRSCGKVLFLRLSVSHSVHRGRFVSQHALGRHTHGQTRGWGGHAPPFPPGPVKISHKKDGHWRRPHRFHVSLPLPYPAAGSATANMRGFTCREETLDTLELSGPDNINITQVFIVIILPPMLLTHRQ